MAQSEKRESNERTERQKIIRRSGNISRQSASTTLTGEVSFALCPDATALYMKD
jgi:hypothetical protein